MGKVKFSWVNLLLIFLFDFLVNIVCELAGASQPVGLIVGVVVPLLFWPKNCLPFYIEENNKKE